MSSCPGTRNKGFVHQENPEWAVSLRIDPESGTRPAATAVQAGSASCAGSEMDRKVGLDSNPSFLSTSDPAQVGHGFERAERFSLFKRNFRNPLQWRNP